jgi:hypothetical protein
MILQAKLKKILEPGIHLATIKNVSVVKDAKGNPASWIDPATGQPTGSLRVLFMGKNGYGIEYDFWLGKAHLKKITALTDALQLKTLPVPKEDVIGRKLFVMVFQVLFFDGQLPRLDANGKQVSMPKLMPRFWIASAQPPVVEGNPQTNGGVASGDFLWHWSEGKYFQPNIVTESKEERFGE